MDDLRAYYSPKKIEVEIRNPSPRVDRTNEYFNPVVAHRWAGYFPLLDPEKEVILDLEPVPAIIFQHVPSFAYYPEHSNIDVRLE